MAKANLKGSQHSKNLQESLSGRKAPASEPLPISRIGFLGGTGVEAQGLALRFAAAGGTVYLGSRTLERARQAAEACNVILGQKRIEGTSNPEMCRAAEIVFLTVPFARAAEAVDSCRSSLDARHVLVDVTVPLIFRAGHAEYQKLEAESNSENIALHLPENVQLVAAFKTIPAAVLADLTAPLDCDLFVCGDNESAKQKVMAAISMIPSLRSLDAGPLRMARTLERMTVLAAELNRRYEKKGARFRVVGI
jgi:NADPH-dependent F420 reductase